MGLLRLPYQEIASAVSCMDRLAVDCREDWWKQALAVAAQAATTSVESMLVTLVLDNRTDMAARKKRIEQVLNTIRAQGTQYGVDLRANLHPLILEHALNMVLG